MKKKILSFMAVLAVFSIIVYAVSQGGTKDDPLVTQSTIDSYVSENIEDYAEKLILKYQNPIETLMSDIVIDKIDRLCFVKNDVITGLDMGDKITIRTGDVQILGTGTIVNTSNGVVITNPTSLEKNQSYLVVENSNFTLTVNSATAHIYITGDYSYSNPYDIKYLDYATGLQELGLFKGTNYGFELDRTATRIEALIMFIRLIGEEEQALAYNGTHSFTDVQDWANNYVAYAYNKGYTNGITSTLFGFSQDIRDLDYYTFILRALGYKDDDDFTWKNSYQKAIETGMIDESFAQYDELYRDHLAYLSFKALNVNIKDEKYNLSEILISNNAINLQTYNDILKKLG